MPEYNAMISSIFREGKWISGSPAWKQSHSFESRSTEWGNGNNNNRNRYHNNCAQVFRGEIFLLQKSG